jgi:hypothetical protein
MSPTRRNWTVWCPTLFTMAVSPTKLRTVGPVPAESSARLWFSALAYGLLNALRQQALQQTELANARVGTIRTQLLKLGTLIRVSVRRIHLAFHSSFPRRDLFGLAYQRLLALANSS